jgi:hypothetical protein
VLIDKVIESNPRHRMCRPVASQLSTSRKRLTKEGRSDGPSEWIA